MRKNKSFIKQILLYLLILMSLLIFIIGAFLASSYVILKNEIQGSSDTFFKIYNSEMNNNITQMNSLLADITTQREYLANIKSSDENKRQLSSLSLQNYMQDLLSRKGLADVIVIYDKNYNICLDAIKPRFNCKEKNNLREFTRSAVDNNNVNSFEWNFQNINNKTYMYKMLINDNMGIAIYISANNLLESLSPYNNSNRSIALVDKAGFIGKVWGNTASEIKAGANVSNINTDNYYMISENVVPGQLKIFCYTNKGSVFQQIHASMFVVAMMVCLAVLFIIFILHYTKKDIADPMGLIISDMEKIKSGQYSNRIDQNFNSKEFQMLQETTNQMVDVIVKLKIQSYEKRISLQDMELKSIRLQLRPHFFLNALTTISSLSRQNKNEQIITFIQALSKNVRYMFQAGLHTVTVKEEIRHVENYFDMQELKYPGGIFHLIDLPCELGEWRIPNMLVHTFIENEYKHAVSAEKILTVLIKISKQEFNGEENLMIEIEDDGNGYPKEVLDYMNSTSKKTSENGSHVGLWSIKRMMELMYEKDNLVQLENIKPHGCMNRIYVPEKPKNELK